MKIFAIEAVILDMDGVLINTLVEIESFWLRWAHHHHMQLTAEDLRTKVHGCPTHETLESLFTHLTPAQKEEIAADDLELELKGTYHPMPGVLSLLNHLKENQVKLALVTSAYPAKTQVVLPQLGLMGVFDSVVTANLVEKGKPHPACYQLAAAQLQVAPEKCLVFEDAVPGTTAAKAAGMQVIGINTPDQADTLVEMGAELVIPDFTHLTLCPLQEKTVRVSTRTAHFDVATLARQSLTPHG